MSFPERNPKFLEEELDFFEFPACGIQLITGVPVPKFEPAGKSCAIQTISFRIIGLKVVCGYRIQDFYKDRRGPEWNAVLLPPPSERVHRNAIITFRARRHPRRRDPEPLERAKNIESRKLHPAMTFGLTGEREDAIDVTQVDPAQVTLHYL